MPAPNATSALFAASLGVAAALVAEPAGAALLDEPPKLYSFKLDGSPQAARLPLLDAFREVGVDHGTSLRRYLAGQYGRWRAQPWSTLAWVSDRSEAPADAERVAPVDSGGLASQAVDDGVLAEEERLFGFEAQDTRALRLPAEPAPTWLGRLDPSFAPPVLATTGATFASNGFDALWSLPPTKPIRDWRCRRRPVAFVRFGGESDAFALVRCDGSVAPEALDRLTLMARIPDAARSGQLLPDEPDPEAARRGEWIDGARLVHPRLLWLLQRVADAFPWRTIYVFSGYRRDHDGRPSKPGTHHSMHSEARAMDINVMGVPNAALFQFCRTLDDVGCGFYPNSKFVHVDVRRPRTGRAYWIDISGPGEPSNYVDSWPGVVESGALVWDPVRRAAEQATLPGSDPSCTRRGSQ